MTTLQAPTPPAGTRWREEKYTTTNGVSVVARYANGWQCLYNNGKNWVGHGSFHQLCVADADLERVWSLRTTPTEPLPAPAVDRSGDVWQILWLALREAPGFNDEVEFDSAADQTFLALAPHWRELAALAGEKCSTTRLVTDTEIVQAFNTAFQAVGKTPMSYESPMAREIVAAYRRLAVVEDAS